MYEVSLTIFVQPLQLQLKFFLYNLKILYFFCMDINVGAFIGVISSHAG